MHLQRKIFNHKRNRLQGFLSTPNQLEQTETVEVDILDRLGTGDAFSVGIIYGIMKQWDLKDTVQFGINNMVYKHNVIGDYSYANLEK